MKHGYNANLTIDRIDNNKNYEPSNCRWITIQQQQYNKTTSKYITYNGETKTLVEWAKILNENEEVDNLYVNNKTLFVGANMMLLNGK